MSALKRFLAESAMLPCRSLPILLSSRVRLARNIADEIFPERLSSQRRYAIKKRMLEVLLALPEFENASVFEMQELALAEAEILVERHLISKELLEREGAAVVISQNQKIAVMINEEDHFRIQALDAETNLSSLSSLAHSVAASIGKKLRFAESPRYGFLTACPTNLGTGIRVSVMAHLPGLIMDGQMGKVVRSLNMCGLAVRGWLGEGSDAAGSIFQISNQRTLGTDAEKIVANLQEWQQSLVEQERNARRRVLRKSKNVFFDQIGRIYGESRFGVLLSAGEALSALSLLRLACDLGIFPEYARARFDDLLIEGQNAHVFFRNKIAGTSHPNEFADSCRAKLFREAFATIPPPDFSKF